MRQPLAMRSISSLARSNPGTGSAINDDDRDVREAIDHHLLGMRNNANGLSASTEDGMAA